MAAAAEEEIPVSTASEEKKCESKDAYDSKDSYDDGESELKFDWMPEGKKPLADGEYDVCVLGTGFTECLLSGLLSVKGMKVMVVDRNNYYGGESASLNLTNLFKKFNNGEAPPPEFFQSLAGPYGVAKDRDYNIDLIPKFIMAHGNLVKILLHTKTTRYLDFKAIDGSFVYKSGKVHKVPCSSMEAVKSGLMTIFEKRNFRNFLLYMYDYDPAVPSTWKGRDLKVMSAQELYSAFNLTPGTMNFIGHAMALFLNDSYLQEPAIHLIEAVQLYANSLTAFENAPSPYLYPVYGLGGLPEAFSRLAAINGGVFMLNRTVDEILFDDDGKAWGIRGGDEIAKCKCVIGDPSYFPSTKIRPTGQVVRSLCLLDHPITGVGRIESAQVIIPGAQVDRTNDIYVSMVSKPLEVTAAGLYLVTVSTRIEGSTPNPLNEVEAGIALCGSIRQRWDLISDCFEPISDGSSDRCFISKSYDDTSHFKTAAQDVLDLYARVTGEELDMSISAELPAGDY